MPKAPAGTLYRGREGMWSWVAHRVTGVLIFFFLFAHVLDTALVRVSPEAYNEVIGTYRNPIVGLLEVGLVAAMHLPRVQRPPHHAHRLLVPGPAFHRQMLLGVLGLWVVLFVPFVIRHLTHVFGEGQAR